MTARIGLISDVHSSPDALAEALRIFAKAHVDDIICAGDIAGYHEDLLATVRLLKNADCKAIAGNHDQYWLEKNAAQGDPEITDYLQSLPLTLDLEVEGKRLFVVHANPPCEQHGGIKLRNRDGEITEERKAHWRETLADFEHDALIVGHTHQVYAEQLDKALVINPGSVPFNHSCMILELPSLEVEIFALGEREVILCWNYSLWQSEQQRSPEMQRMD